MEPSEEKPAAVPDQAKTEPKAAAMPDAGAPAPAPTPAPAPLPAPEAKAADPKAAEAKAAEKRPDATPAAAMPEAGAPDAKPGAKPADAKAAAKPADIPPDAKIAAAKSDLRNNVIIGLAILGILAGIFAAYMFGLKSKSEPPVNKPISNPYASAIYANGIIESSQDSGENINIYPVVSGPVTAVRVGEGQEVKAGDPLFSIDDSIQGPDTALAAAAMQSAKQQYDKREASYLLDPKSISKDVLDTTQDAFDQAFAGYKAARALLGKYTVTAPTDGVVLAVNTTAGSYVSPLGSYDAYTQLMDPVVLMAAPEKYLAVRCFVDEILVARLPSADNVAAQMSIRGTNLKIPLEFVRVEPFVQPKIELSDERQEQVDLRVLPVIFRFRKMNAPVYPGQLVDVFITTQPSYDASDDGDNGNGGAAQQ
jgi:HlyD family secretion protein